MKRFLLKYYYLTIVIGALCLSQTNAYAQKFSDDEIKTAFIFNFIKFTKWQQTPNPIKIGIVGNGKLAQTIINKLNGQQIGNSRIDVLFITDSTQIAQYDVVIYVNETAGITPQIIKAHTREKGILSIGLTEYFVQNGGIISLIQNESNKRKFIVNLTNLKESNITLSSKLLTLAQIIK